jgi:hypothetical protein
MPARCYPNLLGTKGYVVVVVVVVVATCYGLVAMNNAIFDIHRCTCIDHFYIYFLKVKIHMDHCIDNRTDLN